MWKNIETILIHRGKGKVKINDMCCIHFAIFSRGNIQNNNYISSSNHKKIFVTMSQALFHVPYLSTTPLSSHSLGLCVRNSLN